MVRHAVITVVLLDKTTVSFNNTTLKEVATQCLSNPLANSYPVLIQIKPDTKLYFNKRFFNEWLHQKIDVAVLFSLTKVLNLVRNIAEIKTENYTVDPGHLWLQKEPSFYELADADTYITSLITFNFEEF